MPINKFWSRYKRLLFIVILFLIPAATLLLGRIQLPRLNLYDRLTSWVVHPLAEAGGNLSGGAGSIWRKYLALVNTSKENDSLKKEISELRSTLVSLEEHVAENERLKKLLSMPDLPKVRKIAAKILGQESAPESVTFILNVGSLDGVKLRQPVLAAEGIAGTISKVYRNTSVFSAISDPSHAVDGTIVRSRARFIVQGQGKSLLGRLKYLDRADDIRVGDLVLSSGLDGVFPNSLQIGHIVSVNRPRTGVMQSAELRPSVDFGQLEEVMILETQEAPLTIHGVAPQESDANQGAENNLRAPQS